MTVRLLFLISALIALLGCNRGAQSESAVRQGVVDYLAKRSDLNMSQMNVNVSAVSFRENEADATVSIAPKGGGGAPMQIRYTLVREGSRWVVKGKGKAQEGHGMAPPGMGEMPSGHPPVSGAQPGRMPPAQAPAGKDAQKQQ